MAAIAVVGVVAFALAVLSLLGPPDDRVSSDPPLWRVVKAVLRWRGKR